MSAKLRAVNFMLKSIGEERVSSLQSGLPDAEDAEATLDQVRLEVLEEGWKVNTDEEYLLYPDMDGWIKIPDQYLSVDTSGRDRQINVVARVDVNDNIRKLYDLKNQTFVWEVTQLETTVKWDLEFEALTPQLQNYIRALAARDFQADNVTSTALDQFVSRKLAEAKDQLYSTEADHEDVNMIVENPSVNAVAFRNIQYFPGRG